MLKKVACPSCGIEFEALSQPQGQPVFCPNCASEVDPHRGATLEELGGYQLVELLGQGGMGQVYRALAPDGTAVAVKVMAEESAESPELQERFDREMEIMASLDHPNIVKVIERGRTGVFKFFVMELIEGTTLRHLIREGRLTEPDILSIAIQTLRALGYAHARGIIHRDIKPENIMLDRAGTVKVTDFGLARKLSFEGPALTATNAFMGTENYMSPEQKINPKAVTHRSDIYSFGVVLYEMLTGGMLPLGIFQPPSAYRPLHDFWDNLVFRLLDLNPDLRPANCDDIAQELETFRQSPPSTAPRPATPGAGAPSSPANAQGATTRSMEDEIRREEARIKKKFQDICEQAQALVHREEFDAAAKTWEQALAFTSDLAERENIQNWIRLCQNKLAERQARQAVVFLCPRCLKPFSLEPDRPLPSRFDCPTCGGTIGYDAHKKRWLPLGDPVNKSPASAETPGRKEKPQTSSPAGVNLRQGLLGMVAVLLAIDLWNPDRLDRLIQQLLALAPGLGLSQGTAGFALRFIIYLVVIYWGCGLAYSLYDYQRPSQDTPPDDHTIFRRK